jgi:orotate phosphoribosyltransferase-like protein
MSAIYQNLSLKFSQKTLGSDAEIPGFYDPKTEYFNFDALWKNLTVKNKVILKVKEFIASDVANLYPVTKILATDTVIINYSYGSIPIVSAVCDLLKKNLVIWTESAESDKGGSKLFGDVSDKDEVLIIHDLLREAITLKGIVNTLTATSKCKINGIVILVNTTDKTELSQLGDFPIKYPVPIYSFVSV